MDSIRFFPEQSLSESFILETDLPHEIRAAKGKTHFTGARQTINNLLY